MQRLDIPELALGAAAVVLLAASAAGAFGIASDDGESDVSPSSSAPGEVAIIDFAFEPPTLQVGVGDQVTWTNEDTAAHTVTSDGEGPLASGDLASGAAYDATFDSAGTYAYICTIHPTMRGTIEVAA